MSSEGKAGGAFLPSADYTFTGNTTFSGTTTLSGTATLTAPVVNTPTGTAATLNTTATKALAASESGKIILLNSATEFVTTLPAPAAGLQYSFIVVAAPAAASYTVVTAASAKILKGMILCSEAALGDSSAGGTTITFADGQAVAGDRVDVVSDGTNWFVRGFAKVAAGITITGE